MIDEYVNLFFYMILKCKNFYITWRFSRHLKITPGPTRFNLIGTHRDTKTQIKIRIRFFNRIYLLRSGSYLTNKKNY